MAITYKSGLCTVDKLRPLSHDDLLNFYNTMVEDGRVAGLDPIQWKTVVEISDRNTFYKRCLSLYSSIVASKSIKKPEPEGAKKMPTTTNRKSAIADNTLIAVTVPQNPKRPGSKAYVRFNIYRPGMTVGEYIVAVGDKAAAMADIRYDSDKGWVTLTPTEIQQRGDNVDDEAA